MRVRLAYGRKGLDVELPEERTTVITPRTQRAARDESAEVLRSLRNPVAGPALRELVRRGQSVAISVCDGTRPQPRHVMIPAILSELDGLVDPDDVVILVATGTHRANSPQELEAMFGASLLREVTVENHDASDESKLTHVGTLPSGVPVDLNTRFLEADVRITTGFVEPHFFAGFSGGPKLVAPGLAGLATTLVLHDAKRIGDPHATWGVTKGNPVHDDVRAISRLVGVDFACDVLLNAQHRIVRAFSGELFAMHDAACEAARANAMAPVGRAFDVVVSTNSGYPLDQNLYQAVKGMSAGAHVVRDGGLVVVAAQCEDGFPDHGGYRALVTGSPSPAALLRSLLASNETIPDQWQAQIQARIQARCRVAVYSDGLDHAALESAHLVATDDVAQSVEEELSRLGGDTRCAVLPEGPQTIAYVAS